jgi:glycosyltransferase involved in cell wall biosynthesis
MEINRCSIIICTYNRLNYLKKCLVSLLALDFSEYEIIIVNDGSTDGTKDYLDGLNNDKIKIIHQESNQGISMARNAGIKSASYDIIAITDDDCVVDKDCLKELIKGFDNEQIGFVIGQIFYIDKNYQGYFPERLVSNINARWPMSSNIVYRKKVLDECGGFDDFYYQYNNEDSELAIRAVSRGYLFNRTKDAIVYHQAMDWTVSSLLRSAKNASVWPVLKKRYPKHYQVFGPPIKFGLLVNPIDYLYLLTSPILIPLLLVRYLINGKRDLKIFFTKWPIYFILRRFYIYKEALRNRVWMF